jgi:hypothetical protein
MNNHIVELTDEEIQSIENGDGINDGIYSPTYEEEDLHYELYCLLEGTGYLEYLVDRNEKAERNLKAMEIPIKDLVGINAYNDILDLIQIQQIWLNRDIEKQWEEYNELHQYLIDSTEKNKRNASSINVKLSFD